MQTQNFATPLRYPGGKQRLTPFIEELLSENDLVGGHYVEPYAGGAGVAIRLLLSRKVSNIHLNDSDYGIYCFWYAVLNRTEELCKLIASASLTIKEWHKRKEILKKCDRRKKLELGFTVFYLNRCNRSGILSAGVIGGINQNGNYKMDARFSRNDLIRRIEAIANFENKIFLTNFDAEYYIKNYIPNLPAKTLIYLDPPYYHKGSELYLNAYKETDHLRISGAIQNELKHQWVLSYDGVPPIVKLYDQRRSFLYDLQYTAANVYKGKEIFVFSDSLNLPQKCCLNNVDDGLRKLLISKTY
jgi:DNA adenine methylase